MIWNQTWMYKIIWAKAEDSSMKKVNLKKKRTKRTVKVLAAAAVASIGLLALIQLFSWADRYDRRASLR